MFLIIPSANLIPQGHAKMGVVPWICWKHVHHVDDSGQGLSILVWFAHAATDFTPNTNV